MPRSAPLRFLLPTFAVLAQAALVSAESAPNGPLAAPAPKAPAAKTETKSEIAPRVRAISPEVAAQLAASVPKFVPAPPKPQPKAEEELPDLREIDKPKNNIIRLPKVVVQEPRPPVFSERAILTEKGIKDIAVQRYISEMDRALNRFNVPGLGGLTIGSSVSPTEARALAMYAEDERLKNMADMKDAATTAAKSDPAQGSYILRESQRTFMRTREFGGMQSGSDRSEVRDLIERERR